MSTHATRMRASGPRVILSYLFDWAVIIVIAVIGATISKVEPNHRPFSLVDPDISFPHVEKEKVSTTVLFVVSLGAPAVIIAIVSLLFVPGPSTQKQWSRSAIWKRKIWEWNVGWMGLALGCAVTVLFTDGLKLLIGKPRPDLLSRCQPNLSDISSYTLGGILDQVSEGTLVSSTICQQSNHGTLKDGFQSFPSGHASFSFAGFFYLALFLCSKFAIKLPYLSNSSARHFTSPSAFSRARPSKSEDSGTSGKSLETLSGRQDSARFSCDDAAAPPLYLLVLPLIPICVATYISTTRFSDFRHHGFDILFGAALGIVISWVSFRMYHLPVARGDGLAWGSRSAQRAFGISVGTSGYVEERLHRKRSDDIEAGQANGGFDDRPSIPGTEPQKFTQQGA